MDKAAIAKAALGAGLNAEQVKARLAAIDKFLKTETRFQTWDMVTSIAAQADGRMLGLHGEYNDWPVYVQEKIFEAMVMQCKPKPGCGIKIVASGCFQDVPWEPCYLRVVVQEFPEKVN